MRVSSSVLLTTTMLVALAEAGPCGYVLTCIGPPNNWENPCTPEARAEFELVAPLLQQCDALTRYFNRDTWDTSAASKFCDVASPCGKLTPYIANTEAYFRLCADYSQFRYVLYTFRGYCRSQPVASLVGDNGLLASLKNAQPPPTTRAPTPPPATTPPLTQPPTQPPMMMMMNLKSITRNKCT
jgi:hypothetical protein